MVVCKLYFDCLINLKGENVVVREMRKYVVWYLKGVRGNVNVCNEINYCEIREEFV